MQKKEYYDAKSALDLTANYIRKGKHSQREIFQAWKQYALKKQKLQNIRKRHDIFVANHARIIGMTTTGTAKHRHILEGTQPEIIGLI